MGLAPQNEAPSPILKYETLQVVEFLPNLNVKPPLHERKAPLLTTFWQRSSRSSGKETLSQNFPMEGFAHKSTFVQETRAILEYQKKICSSGSWRLQNTLVAFFL